MQVPKRGAAALVVAPLLALCAGCSSMASSRPGHAAGILSPDARRGLAGVDSASPSTSTGGTLDPLAGDAVFAAESSPRLREDAAPHHDAGETVLLYLPNRLFDLLDIVRARARVGPGFGFSIRATELADFTVGAYTSVFAGIPGPRRQRIVNWPFGIESLIGAEGSVVDLTNSGDNSPHYGIAEFGIGIHVLIVGADVGVDPWEAVDFVAGIFTFDPVGDDL